MSNLSTHTGRTKRAKILLLLLSTIVTANSAIAAGVSKTQSVGTAEKASDSRADVAKKSEKISDDSNVDKKPLPAKPIYSAKKIGKSVRTPSDSGTSGLLQQMMALVAVILILGVIGWVVIKKFLPRLQGSVGVKGRSIRILETTLLGPRQPVHLIQVGKKKILISGGKDGLRMLTDVTDGFDEQADQADFSSVLAEKQAAQVEDSE